MEIFAEHVIVTHGTFLFYDYVYAFICKISFIVLNYSDTRSISE